MKKNIVGHMTVPREGATGRIKRWGLIPKLICLLLALAVWLLIVNVTEQKTSKPHTPLFEMTETAEQE
jgi:hypothetical protein